MEKAEGSAYDRVREAEIGNQKIASPGKGEGWKIDMA